MLELLDAEALRELASAGVEIGSHSRTHRLMPLLNVRELTGETAGSADDLAGRGVPRPRFFAYPYGARNAAAMNAVAKAGFLAAFGQRPARLRRSSPVYDLPRVEILSTDRGWRFRLKTAAPATYSFVVRKRDALSRRVSGMPGLFSHGR
jgi:peptidoglycan/xylan/chitin deacetylase (PgdA/CDA1 family)